MTTPSGLRLKMLSAIGVRRRGGRAVELLNYLPEAEAEAAGELMQGYAAQPDRDYALEQLIRQMAASERFSSLAEIHPAWFLEQLRSEPPRVIGLILRSLPSKHLRFVLENLPPMLRARIPNLVESFAASKPVLDAIRRRFERRFLPMRITRAIEHPGFDHLYFLKGDDLALVVREIGLTELAIALSGMSSKALHIIYNRLELKEARRLQRRIKGLSGVSPELHRQARFNLLEIEGRHEGAEQMLASVGLAALSCAAADEYDGLVRLLMQKLPPAEGYFLRRCVEARRSRVQRTLGEERREMVLRIIAELAAEGRIDPQWRCFAPEVAEAYRPGEGGTEADPEEETGSLKTLE